MDHFYTILLLFDFIPMGWFPERSSTSMFTSTFRESITPLSMFRVKSVEDPSAMIAPDKVGTNTISAVIHSNKSRLQDSKYGLQ